MKIWLYCYLTGREQRTLFEDTLSNSTRLLSGVPQGGVLSPLLFSWYMSDMPEPKDERVKVVCYADDITMYSQDNDYRCAVSRINNYLEQINEYLESKQLYASPAKCSALLISPWSKEWSQHLGVKLGQSEIPTVKELKLLGVLLDNGFNFGKHVEKVSNIASKRNSVIKALTTPSSGLQKEGLTSIYKALTRSTLNYAAPARCLQVPRSGWEKLERRQNEAMRAITGCIKMSDIDHLRHETRCIPIESHCKLLAAQFAARAEREGHPIKTCLHRKHDRKMKNHLMNHLDSCKEKFEISEEISGKELSHLLHTEFVSSCLTGYNDNKLLMERPEIDPGKVDELEKNLTRQERVTLAQLRSSYCPLLRDYQYRIGKTTNNKCRNCQTEVETANHALECIAKIDPKSLWTDPEKAVKAIQILRA